MDKIIQKTLLGHFFNTFQKHFKTEFVHRFQSKLWTNLSSITYKKYGINNIRKLPQKNSYFPSHQKSRRRITMLSVNFDTPNTANWFCKCKKKVGMPFLFVETTCFCSTIIYYFDLFSRKVFHF